MTDDLLEKTPGKILVKARQNAGLSLREVADTLHLLPRQVEALEKDDYLQFSGDIFCKGYLKTYATLLGLDAAVLIAAYIKIRPASLLNDPGKLTVRNPHIQKPAKGKHIQYWCLAATVIVITLLWLMSGDDGEANSAELVVNETVVIDKQQALAITEKRHSILSQEAVITAELDALVSEETKEKINSDETEAVFTKPVSVADDKLSFIFNSDCWVRVKNSDNTIIYADLKKAGDRLQLNGSAPFKVLLGYAVGVKLDYNGEPVTININSADNSARFVVGS